MKSDRLFYIDNLRIFLISLVVLHHLAITYGAPGGWYYNESQASFPEILPLSMFVASNQAFFMGFFFFISAYFIIPSLERKGVVKFATDRLLRLGIPLLLFYFLLNPLTVWLHHHFVQHKTETYLQFLSNGWARGFGPLWFVEALLIFTFLYLIIRNVGNTVKLKFPGTAAILLFAIFTAILQFLIRLKLPVGWSMPFTNFQFPFFVQYVFLFALGLIAYRNNWTESVTYKVGKRWMIISQAMIFIGFPLLFIVGGASAAGTEPFMGGFTWQNLGYALWEQITGISLMIGLTGIFREKASNQGALGRALSSAAFGVFVFHAPLIVCLSVAFSGWQIMPVLKLILLAVPALVLCFGVAWLVKQIPGLKRVF